MKRTSEENVKFGVWVKNGSGVWGMLSKYSTTELLSQSLKLLYKLFPK